MEEKEIWRDIKGYEGMYQVSNLGRVKSLPRLKWNGKGIHMLKERILKIYITNRGYYRVRLYSNFKGKFFSIHRIVFEAFVGEIPEGMQINHINEDKSDNRLINLNLMTSKENTNWGTRTERARKKCWKKVIMDDNIEFDSITQAAKYLGCSQANVSACCTNITHTVYGHHFRYK